MRLFCGLLIFMQKDYDFLITLILTSSELYPNLENSAIVSERVSNAFPQTI